MARRILEMGPSELLDAVRGGELGEGELLEVLRNPFCTVEVAEAVAGARDLLGSTAVRERLSAFRGLPLPRAIDLIATLPWPSLVAVAQSPSSPPMVRRQAEKKLLSLLPRMTLGEKVAIARKVHRPLLRSVTALADVQVLVALLDNPRLTEDDILVILNTIEVPAEFCSTLARHHRWGGYYGIRLALAECPRTPLPVALSALVQLRTVDLEQVARRQRVAEPVRVAALALKVQESKGLRRVIRSSGDGLERAGADPPDDPG
jgi:hypothetical protein